MHSTKPMQTVKPNSKSCYIFHLASPISHHVDIELGTESGESANTICINRLLLELYM